MRADLLTHPKVVRMASMLKADRLRVIGGLFAVWCLFDAHTEDGRLHGYTDEVLNEMVGFKGFAGAMRAVKWLQYEEDGLALPEFGEHNGKSAKVRAEDTKRKRNDRTNPGQMSDDLPDKTRTEVGQVSDEPPDKTRTKTGPEKRREEKSINTLAPNGACPLPDDEPEVHAKPDLPDCPYSHLRELWKTHLPHLRQPRVWEGQRKVSMRNRWRQAANPSEFSPEGYATEAQGVAWWDGFFGYVARETRLANGFENNGRSWQPDLEWVCKAANFQKIIDGNYAK